MFGRASMFLWADVRTPPGTNPISYEEYEAGVEEGRHYETWWEYERAGEVAGEKFGPSRLAGAAGERPTPFGSTLDESLLPSTWEASFSRSVPQQTWEQAFGSAGRAPILGEGTLP